MNMSVDSLIRKVPIELVCFRSTYDLGLFSAVAVAEKQTVVVASKNFNESYLLSEMLSQMLEAEGYEVERKIRTGWHACLL